VNNNFTVIISSIFILRIKQTWATDFSFEDYIDIVTAPALPRCAHQSMFYILGQDTTEYSQRRLKAFRERVCDSLDTENEFHFVVKYEAQFDVYVHVYL